MTHPGKVSAWLLSKVRKGQVWCALLSLSLGLSVASAVDSGRTVAPSQPWQLEDRAVDPSLVDGRPESQDPPPSSAFYLALGGSLLAFFLLLSLFNGWVVRGLLGEAMEKEKSGILLLSQFSLALYALHLVAGVSVPESLRLLLHLICGLLLLSMVVKYAVAVDMRSDRKWALVWGLLNDDQLMLGALFMPAVLISMLGLVGGALNPLEGRPTLLVFVVYLIVLVFLLVGYLVIGRLFVANSGGGAAGALYDLNTALLVAGAPLILIPVSALFANEVQFAVPAAEPRTVGLVLVAVLGLVSVSVFVLQRRGFLRLGGAAVITGFYFPTLVATLASFKTHLWTLRLGTLDYFRTGQKALPAQQFWEFGSVPLLDLLPSGGLADAGVSSLFALFHGVDGLDMLVWLPWLPVVVGFLIIYAFLAAVTSPLLALLVTVLLPVKAAVVGQYAVVLLPAVVLVATLRRPDLRRFLTLWLVTAALVLWRPQLGGPAVLALLVVVGLVVLFDNRENAAPAFLSLALVLGLVPAGLLVAEVFWAGDTAVAFSGLVGLLASSGARGFGAIATGSGMTGVTSMLQQLLPVLAVLCVLYFCLRQFVRRQAFTASGYAILYLVIFSLVTPARTVFAAGRASFDPSLLLLTLVLLPFFIFQEPFRPRHVGRSAWLLATLVFCALLGSIDFYHLVGGGGQAHRQLRTWQAGDSRVLFNPRPHEALVGFLQRELEDKESFLDFTGSTALYPLAGKRYPLRTISDLRTTSESLQRSQIESLDDRRLAGELPLIVFRSPPLLTRSTRNPPAEALSYRLAEYVYSHYLPYVRVDGWELWRERGVTRQKPTPPAKMISSTSVQQNFRLGSLPHRWAHRDPWQSVDRTDVLALILDQQVLVRPGAPMPLTWQPEADLPVATYLHIRARPLEGEEPSLTVSYGPEPQSSFEFRLEPWTMSPRDGEEIFPLEIQEEPRKHKLHRISRYPDRFAFRSTGRDPWLHRFLDLSAVPPMEAAKEQWIAIRYRSEKDGVAQVFFTKKNEEFQGRWSLKSPVTATQVHASAQWMVVPVLGLEQGVRLSNLRLDPPSDCDFEILEVQLIHRPAQSEDYLIRLTTQYQWTTGTSHPIVLSSDAQILIDGIYLRAGD